MSSFQLQENLLIEFKDKTDIYFKNKVSVSKKQKNASDVQEGTGSRIGKDVRNQGSLLCLSRFCLTWSFCFILLFFCTLAFPLPHIQIHGTEGCSLVLLIKNNCSMSMKVFWLSFCGRLNHWSLFIIFLYKNNNIPTLVMVSQWAENPLRALVCDVLWLMGFKLIIREAGALTVLWRLSFRTPVICH